MSPEQWWLLRCASMAAALAVVLCQPWCRCSQLQLMHGAVALMLRGPLCCKLRDDHLRQVPSPKHAQHSRCSELARSLLWPGPFRRTMRTLHLPARALRLSTLRTPSPPKRLWRTCPIRRTSQPRTRSCTWPAPRRSRSAQPGSRPSLRRWVDCWGAAAAAALCCCLTPGANLVFVSESCNATRPGQACVPALPCVQARTGAAAVHSLACIQPSGGGREACEAGCLVQLLVCMGSTGAVMGHSRGEGCLRGPWVVLCS